MALVYRYRLHDGLEVEEGTFLICTFWLAQALAEAGQLGSTMQMTASTRPSTTIYTTPTSGTLLRTCNVQGVPLAINVAAADRLISSPLLLSGPRPSCGQRRSAGTHEAKEDEKGASWKMSYDMLEPGQGTFVLRRWLYMSGADPFKRPDRSMELRPGPAGRFAAFTEGENHDDARAHSQRWVRQPQAEAAR